MTKKAALTKREQELILKIAMQSIYAIEARGDMESRDNDDEDMIGTTVMSIEAALETAYLAGKAARD